MDKRTTDKLTEQAPAIAKFLELHPDDQEWLFPLLGKAEKRAIAILEAIEDIFLSYEKIAEITECHPNTVKLILYALDNGGVPLTVDRSGRWTSPSGGRPRRLVKL